MTQNPAGTGAAARALQAQRARELPPEEAEAQREAAAARAFLTSEEDADHDGVVDTDEAETAAALAGENAAELMGADGDPAIEAEVTEQVFDAELEAGVGKKG